MTDIKISNNIEAATADGSSNARRRILRTIIAGGGAVTTSKMVPAQWKQPIIDAVSVPAHANTSNPDGDFATDGSVEVALLDPAINDRLATDDSLSDELLEFFLPSAQAGGCNVSCMVTLEGNFMGNSAILCTSGDESSTETFTINTGAVPPKLIGGIYLGSLFVEGGEFTGSGWAIDVRYEAGSNVSQSVTLSPGGVGCL